MANEVLTFNIDRERRDLDVAEKIAELEPDVTPLTVILMKARKRPAGSAEYTWYEDELVARWTRVNNAVGYDTAATSIVVDDGTLFQAKDVVKNARTGEVMFVSAVATNTLTVVRAYGTTAAAAMNDNDWLVILGNAMEENSSMPAMRSSQPTKLNNYTQIFRTPFGVSATEATEGVKTDEAERSRLSQKYSKMHRLDLERAILFGEKKEDLTNKRRMMGGILSRITTNVYDAGGALTESEFETSVCEVAFRYGSKKKLLVASPRLISVINQWAAGKMETVPKSEVYGLSVKRYISAHGELLIVRSDVLENEYSGYGFILDIENIEFKPLNGRDTKLRRNIQGNDVDGYVDEYLTEATSKVALEKTHMVIKNVTG